MIKRISGILGILLFLGTYCYSAELGAGEGSGYPTALDTDDIVESTNTVARADVPNDLASAIVKIMTELGIAPSEGYTDVVSRLVALMTSTTALNTSLLATRVTTGTINTSLLTTQIATGTINTSLLATQVATGTINTNFLNYKGEVQTSTTSIQAELTAVKVSTGTLVQKAGDTMTGNLTVNATGYFEGVEAGTYTVRKGIVFPDGSVQISSPPAGGWVGTATSDLNMGNYTFAVSSITGVTNDPDAGKIFFSTPIVVDIGHLGNGPAISIYGNDAYFVSYRRDTLAKYVRMLGSSGGSWFDSSGVGLNIRTVTDHIVTFYTNNAARWAFNNSALNYALTSAAKYDIGFITIPVGTIYVSTITTGIGQNQVWVSTNIVINNGNLTLDNDQSTLPVGVPAGTIAYDNDGYSGWISTCTTVNDDSWVELSGSGSGGAIPTKSTSTVWSLQSGGDIYTGAISGAFDISADTLYFTGIMAYCVTTSTTGSSFFKLQTSTTTAPTNIWTDVGSVLEISTNTFYSNGGSFTSAVFTVNSNTKIRLNVTQITATGGTLMSDYGIKGRYWYYLKEE